MSVRVSSARRLFLRVFMKLIGVRGRQTRRGDRFDSDWRAGRRRYTARPSARGPGRRGGNPAHCKRFL